MALGRGMGAGGHGRVALLALCLLALPGWSAEVTPATSSTPKPAPAAPKAHKPAGQAPAPAPAFATAGTPQPAVAPVAAATPADAKAQPQKPLPRAIASAAAVARTARLEGGAERTRFVLELSRTVGYGVFPLADPYRVVIDMQGVDFQLPSGIGASGQGLVTGYRYGLLAPGRSRIVIDTSGPVKIDTHRLGPGRPGESPALVLELVPTEREAFLAAMAAGSAAKPPPPAAPAVRKPAPGPRPDGKPLIVLDPGHGGIDAGTTGSQNKAEKTVVLAFAKLLRDKLRATKRYEVLLTREQDVFVALDERVRFAREHGASLFISLHTDSVPATLAHLNVRGATVFTISEKANDAEARALAEKENRSDVIAGVETREIEDGGVSGILADLVRRETYNHSRAFTHTLLGSLRQAAHMSREPDRSAAFRVLKAPDVPSVLVELGFLSNKDDEQLLLSRPWQEKVSGSIVDAVDRYFARRVARSAKR